MKRPGSSWRIRPGTRGAVAAARRNQILLVGALALLLVLLLVAAALTLGGPEGERGSSPSAGRQQAPGGEGRPAAPAREPSADSGAGAASEPLAPADQEPVDAQQVSDALGPPPGGGVPPGEVAIEVEEGRTNGQRGFAAEFVGRAYGYSGSDPAAYLAGIEGRVNPGSYYASPAGAEVEDYAKVVAGGGAENATVLEDYRILYGPAVNKPLDDRRAARLLTPQANRVVSEGYTDGQLSGATLAEVSYAIGDRYGDPAEGEDFAEVYGDVEHYSQTLLVLGEGSALTILAGDTPRRIPDPGEATDQKGPLAADPQGPGQDPGQNAND